MTEMQHAPWEYMPTDPILLVAQETDENETIEIADFDTLAEAMAHFARFHVGPMEHRRVAVIDAEHRLVIGYQDDVEFGLNWWGIRVGFDMLERLHDRASVVLWAASVQSDLNRPVKDVVV